MNQRGTLGVFGDPGTRRVRLLDRIVGAVWRKVRVVVLRASGADQEDCRTSEDWVRYCGLIHRR